MSYSPKEKKILKKLGIKDFRYMTKDKIVQFASMLPKMNPEVAKAALAQFPNFTLLAKDAIAELRVMSIKAFDLSDYSQQSFFDACGRILTTLEKELENDNLTPEQRSEIQDKMIEVAKMIGEKDKENKKFTEHMMEAFVGFCGIVVLAGAAILGATATTTSSDDSQEPNDETDSSYILEGEYEDIPSEDQSGM